MCNLPKPGIKPVFPELAGGFLSTVSTGNSSQAYFWMREVYCFREQTLRQEGKGKRALEWTCLRHLQQMLAQLPAEANCVLFKYNCALLPWVFVVLVVSLSHVWFFETSWTVACQAPLSSAIFWTLLKFMSIESVMVSNCLILCHPFSCPQSFPASGKWVSSLHQVAKVLELQFHYQSFQWIFKVDLL